MELRPQSYGGGADYTFPYWEVLNEVDAEHHTTPEQYTHRYDAIVRAIHAVSPQTKFMGIALGGPSSNPRFFEYFLDHSHHAAGIPLDYISYHFYATPSPSETVHDWQYTFFDQADRFLATVRYIQQIRQRLSPGTKTDTDELGVILPMDDNAPIPAIYWNAAGTLYGYLYIHLAQQGIEVIGESQLVGYPSQVPSVTMIDWKNGKPNARYWVLKLIKDNFGPGDRMVKTGIQGNSPVIAQAFLTKAGRKLLLVNRRDRIARVKLPAGADRGSIEVVDEATGEGPAESSTITGQVVPLSPFAVAVVKLK